MTPSKRLATACIVALFALQFAWHAWLAPPTSAPPLTLAGFFALPILPAMVLLLLRHRAAAFWGGLAALLYFSHGVMVAWSSPGERGLALAQVGLSAVLVVAASVDGLRSRFARRRPAPPAV